MWYVIFYQTETDSQVFFRAFFRESKDPAFLPEHKVLKDHIRQNHNDLEEIFGRNYRKQIPLALEYMQEREYPKQVNIYHVVSLFLLEISRLCSKNFFKEAVLFLSHIIAAANQKGQEYEQNLGFHLPIDPKLAYSLQRDAMRLSEITIAFIVSEFGGTIEKNAYWLYRQNGVFPNMFGVTKESLIRTACFVNLFVAWLVNHELTDTSLEIQGLPTLVPSFLQDHIL